MVNPLHSVGLHVFRSYLVIPLHIILPLSFILLLFPPCILLQNQKQASASTLGGNNEVRENTQNQMEDANLL